MRESGDVPDGLTLKRNRDLAGRRGHVWVRRGLLLALAAFVALGLANVFGQETSTDRAAGPDAELVVAAPTRARGGLLYQARFSVRAREELKDAQLVLSPGWLDGLTVNTIEPSPLGEASADGSLSLDLGHVPAGERHDLYVDFQVNPTTLGRRAQDVELLDGDTTLLSVHRTLTVFP